MTHEEIYEALYGSNTKRAHEALSAVNAMTDKEYIRWVTYRNARQGRTA